MTAFHLGLLVGVALGMLAGFLTCILMDQIREDKRRRKSK